MVRPLFDTNILIDYLGGIALARDELRRYPEPAISIVSSMEVLIGAAPDVEPATRRFLSRFTIVEIDRAVAERRGDPPQGQPIRLPDALIQASAVGPLTCYTSRATRGTFDSTSPSVRVPYAL